MHLKALAALNANRHTMERVTEAGAVYETDHRDGSTMAHHRHDAPFATIVLRGSYVEVRDAVPERCLSGAIVVHGIGEEHADRFSDETRCLNVELQPHGARVQRCGAIALDTPELRDAVATVVRSFYRETPKLDGAVRRLQSLLAEPREERDERPSWLREVMDAFPLADGISLRSAAAMAGVHETHFSRAFRRYVGVTAVQYRTQARIRRASSLLLETPLPIARIAASCGFSDQSHLTRAFSERLGLTPAAYRRAFAR
jgi:AraC family transcriptional regulator